MNNIKKKRSPNFTLEDKENLLSLVTRYKGVVECKRSGAFYIQKKKEVWKAITTQFNSLSIAELPTEMNHETVDETMLHVSVVESDSEIYTDEFHTAEVHTEEFHTAEVHTEEVPLIDEKTIKDLKKKWTDDKKNIKNTGGGSFDPTLTDADHQILAILDNQIRPVENPYDEAAQYFGDTLTEDKPTPKPEEIPKRKPINSTVLFKKRTTTPKTDCKKSAEKMYFKKKIELTYYQKKNEMLKYRNEQKKQQLELQKHGLQMKILKKQLDKIDSNVTQQ